MARGAKGFRTWGERHGIRDGMTKAQVDKKMGHSGSRGRTDSEGTEYHWDSGNTMMKFDRKGRLMKDEPGS